MGVVEKRYIDILIILLLPFSTPLVLYSSFLAAASLLLCSFLNVFTLFLCNIANIAQKTFEIVQKSRSRECRYNYKGHTINYINRNVESTSTARARFPRFPRAKYRVPRDVSSNIQLTLLRY